MKQPNDRQKALAKYVAEHSGISLNQAMKDMDYSEAYAHNSHQLKKTKTWRYLMRHVLPNSKLVKVVDEGLGAMRVISAMNTGKQASGATSDFIEVPDHAVRHKFVETALKMKGKLIDKSEIKVSELKGLVGLETTNEKET